MTGADLASCVDAALLRPDHTTSDLDRFCREARDLGVKAACVYPGALRRAAERLGGSSVLLCGVVGFPHGGTTLLAKCFEALEAFKHGAVELDVVLSLSAIASGEREIYEEEIRTVMDRTPECRHKFILETGLFSRETLRPVIKVLNQRRPAFVKTSTGMNGPGARVDAVAWLRAELHPSIGIKASGGVRTRAQAESLLRAGATRIGTSRAAELLRGASGDG